MLGFHRQTLAYLWPAWSKPEEMGLNSLVGIIWGWFTDLISSGMIWANKKIWQNCWFHVFGTFNQKMGLRPDSWGRTSTSPKLPENKPLEVVIHVWIVVEQWSSTSPYKNHHWIHGFTKARIVSSCRRKGMIEAAFGSNDLTITGTQWTAKDNHHSSNKQKMLRAMYYMCVYI